jgi:trans-aconitate 2-methyltransferase
MYIFAILYIQRLKMIKENATAKDVTDFYDNFWRDKKREKVNTRHRLIRKNLVKYGLKSDSKILEIGCGNGILTEFIAGVVTNGKVMGVDISPETIKALQQRFAGHKNIRFAVSDMSDYKDDTKYDFIVLPDVLEHIPVEYHANIFKTLKNITHDNSVIYINIPHPRGTEYLKVHSPHLMQVIDQEIEADKLCADAYAAGFYLEKLESYAIAYHEYEYQSIVFLPKFKRKSMTPVSKTKIIIRSVLLRIFG